MINDLRELIGRRPSVPFTIHTVDGGATRVPTIDHVHITPGGARLFAFYDNGSWDSIRPLMISRLTNEQETNGAGSAA